MGRVYIANSACVVVTTTTTTVVLVTTTTTTGIVSDCTGIVSHDGSIGYPITYSHNIGTTQGNVTLYFGAGAGPERWIILIDGDVYLDTGYIGDVSVYGLGGAKRAYFNAYFSGKVDPITLSIYPFSHASNESDGYPKVFQQLWLTGLYLGESYYGVDYLCFNKNTSSSTVVVNVYAPIPSMGWAYLLSCPGYPCGLLVTTTTTTSIPTTTTSTTQVLTTTTTVAITTTTTTEIIVSTTTTTQAPVCVDYGLLYNFAAIENPGQLAPTGYRVATLADIQELITYLGGELTAGGKLKKTDIWSDPNTGATNETGFSALPAGTRDELGAFADRLLKTTIWLDNR